MISLFDMKRFLVVLALVLSSASVSAVTFRVEDIRLEGLQRVSASPVFAALPVSVGEEVDNEDVREIIRSLFETGFFTNVQVARDGNVLIIILQERPAIKSVELEGNKAIKDDQLTEVLTDNDIAEGEILQRHTLQQITRELERQYVGRSRYGATVETKIEELPNNMVDLTIEIDEGKSASIKHINIVGNTVFTEEELLDAFELKESVWWKILSSADNYVKEKLSGDIETLESFYLDRGYLDFKVLSSQVSVSPDMESVFITLNIHEGDIYTVNSVDLAGDPILPEERLKKLVLLRSGDRFSQQLMTATSEYITSLLGNSGYTNAAVEGIPEKNEEANTVDLTFFVDPGQRVYVRRVDFRGNTKTSDEVLRRELRQIEGASASNSLIEQSKVRMERLGYFKGVTVEKKDVPGTADMIDVEYTVEEQPSGSITASVGYAETYGLTLGINVQQSNWLGTGKQVSFGINKNRFQTLYSYSYNDPYFTPDGVSRGFNLFYRTRDFSRINSFEYTADTYGGMVNFGYPISEISRVGAGFGFNHQEIDTGAFASKEILTSPTLQQGRGANYITQSDYERYILGGVQSEFILPTYLITDDMLVDTEAGFLNKYGTKYDSGMVNFNWSRITLNRGVLATRGTSQRLGLEATIPGSDLEYYKITYDAQAFKPLVGDFTLRFKTTLGYGDGYGEMDELPFFENFYAGGFGSVRGFRRSSLGPKGTRPEQYFLGDNATGRTYSGWQDYNRNGVREEIAWVDVNENGQQDEGEFVNEYMGLGSTYVLCEDPTSLRLNPLSQASFKNCRQGELLTTTGYTQDVFGGNIMVQFSTELILPIPFIEDTRTMQLALFVDAGNVFSSSCGAQQINCSDLDFSRLSSSAGIGFTWISGFGPMTFSYSKVLNENPGDRREAFQFTMGAGF